METETIFSRYLKERHLLAGDPLPFSACTVVNEPLLRRSTRREPRSVLMLAAPYRTGNETTNLSCYAVSKDYHLFFRDFFADFLAILRDAFPEEEFACFADHSPIDERTAAAMAGLGCIGDNGLLITKEYGSYIFLGELLSTLPPEVLCGGELPPPNEIRGCLHCGACRTVCPADRLGGCLSALTQAKGELSPEVIAEMKAIPTVWGCDLCQSVCPMNRGVKESEIGFFREDRIPILTSEILAGMNDDTFAARAYAWRGRAVIARNLRETEQ